MTIFAGAILPDNKLREALCFDTNKFAPGAYQVRCDQCKGVGVISQLAVNGSAESGVGRK
jgi:hypothetical protein